MWAVWLLLYFSGSAFVMFLAGRIHILSFLGFHIFVGQSSTCTQGGFLLEVLNSYLALLLGFLFVCLVYEDRMAF